MATSAYTAAVSEFPPRARTLPTGNAVDFALLQTEVALKVDRLRLIEAQLTRLTREIETLYAKLHPSNALRTIPGIGLALGPLVLGVLHEAFAACFPASKLPAALASPGRPSPSPATTGSSGRFTSRPMPRDGSIPSWPRFIGA